MSEPEHGWEHVQCPRCWIAERGLHKPHRLDDAPAQACCFCGENTTAGIYRRLQPGNARILHCPDLQLDTSLFSRPT